MNYNNGQHGKISLKMQLWSPVLLVINSCLIGVKARLMEGVPGTRDVVKLPRGIKRMDIIFLLQ